MRDGLGDSGRGVGRGGEEFALGPVPWSYPWSVSYTKAPMSAIANNVFLCTKRNQPRLPYRVITMAPFSIGKEWCPRSPGVGFSVFKT